MKRILHIEALTFAMGFVLGALAGDPGDGVVCAAIIGLVACGAHRLFFRATPAVVVLLGCHAALLAGALGSDPAASRFAEMVGDEKTDVLISAAVVEGPRAWPESESYIVELESADRRQLARVRVALWVSRRRAATSSARPGDSIEVFARCSRFAPREFPGVTSARERWAAKGIGVHCSALEPVDVSNRGGGIRARLTERRLALERRLIDLLGRRAGVPMAMLTGTRGFVRDSEWLAHRRAGTAHLLAISGLHFGSIATVAWLVVGFLFRRVPWVARRIGARRASAPVVLVAMAAYLVAVGAPVSAMRAFVAIAAFVSALLFFRRPSGLAAVSVAAVAILAPDTSLVRDLGFQLSFCATVAIVGFWARLPDALQHDPYTFEDSRWRSRVKALARYMLMSWFATLATWPLILSATGQWSPVALVTNPLVVPWVAFVVFPALLAGALLLEFLPVLGEPLVVFATEAMLQTTVFVEQMADLPGAVQTPGAIGSGVALFAAGCAIVVAGSKLRPIVAGPALALLIAVVVVDLPRRPPGWRVHFIPVGQGDATLVEFATGERVLFDAGGSRWGRDPGRHVVVPYLWRLGITRLDAIVVTHTDTDHAGGVPAVIELVDVARVISQPTATPIPGLTLERWAERGSKNNRSIVARIVAGPAAILLTGDVEQHAERQWLGAKPSGATALKVPHHGSNTSSTAEFLDAVRPSMAVVSAGRNNRFGHPHPWVVERYEDRAVPLFSTADNGLVRADVACDGTITLSVSRQ